MQVLFIGVLAFVVIARMLGLARKSHLYLGIAFSGYMLSFLSVFTIGLWVLSITFMAGALAFAHSFSLVKTVTASAVAVLLGIASWAVAITYIDNQWIFIPFGFLMS